MKYRKKPVEVEAEVYNPGMEDGFWCCVNIMAWPLFARKEFCKKIKSNSCEGCKNLKPYIKTLEGRHIISPGDYIITGVKGERYPCKAEIFLMTYEKA